MNTIATPLHDTRIGSFAQVTRQYLIRLTRRAITIGRAGLLLLSIAFGLFAGPAFALTATTTVLTSGTNPATVGQSVTLTATVTGTTPTGTLTFKDGATTIGTGTISAGKATLATTFATKASHSLTAVYGGDAVNATSTSAALAETVNIRTTTTVLASGTNPATVGQSVTLTATVTGTNATGNVTFKDGTTMLGTGAVSAGKATFAASFATVASHSLTAVYAGDTNNATSTSAAIAETVTIRATTTVLASGTNPAPVGQSVTLTANVTGTNATGNVTFKDGATTLGTGAVSAGVATFAATFTTAGSRSLTAVYAGNTNNATSTSVAVTQTVTARASTTVLTSSVNPANVAQSTTLTATITGTSPIGTVTFKDGATTLGTGTVVAGKATFAATFAAAGSHSLTATYAGDANNATSTSVSFTQTVNPRATTTALTSGTNPAKVGQNVTLTATVTGTSPTGTVTFKDGAVTLGTGTVSAGAATFVAAFASVGSHSLTAVYQGDANNATSTSAVRAQTVNVATSTTSLATSASSVPVGQSVTLTATVAGATPSGTVTFKDGAATMGIGTVSAGVATYAATFGTAGTHNLTAVYAGDGNNASSTSSNRTQTVTASASSTVLIVSPNPVGAGRDVTMTATITGNSPTGYIDFRDGGTQITTVPVTSGSAVLVWNFGPGVHALSAFYPGDANNTTSTSATVNETVQINSTSTALTTSAASALVGQSVDITATVTGYFPGGTVTLTDGATYLGGGPISGGGTYVLSTTFNTPGNHNLVATYSGDGYNAASTSATLVEAINQVATATTLAASPNPVNSLGIVTMTATVAGSNPTGTVTFKDGPAIIGTVELSSATAALGFEFILAGAHNLTATYGGDILNAASSSAAVVEIVNLNPSALALSASPNPAQLGASVYLTATLTANGLGNGTVIFKDGNTVLGTATSNGPGASLSTSFAAVGNHTLTAVYSGDASESGSTSPPLSVLVTPVGTSVVVSSATNPANVGQPVTLTATVAGTNPTGSVTFTENGTVVGTSPVSAGVATIVATFGTVGIHGVTAAYSGDTNNLPSGPFGLAQTVNIGSSSVVLTSAVNPAAPGQGVLLTATVAGVNPTGTITFKDGGTVIGPSPMTAGAASYGAVFSNAGAHSLTAVYNGDANNSFSASNAVVQTIASASPGTTLSVSQNPVTAGASVTLSALVVGNNPTGTVTFKDGSTTLGSASLNAWAASMSTSFGTTGAHNLTAVYGGDGVNPPSTSAIVVETVNGTATTTTALTSNANPAPVGQAVTLSAVVSGSNLTGSVTFRDNGIALGTNPLAAGISTLTTSFSTGGTHNLTANYSGDTANTSSQSAVLAEYISGGAVATTTALSSSATTVNLGQNVTFTATVTGNSPTGQVTFRDNTLSRVLGTANLSAGVASFTTSFDVAGGHFIMATYAGDTVNAEGSSLVVTETVNQGTTTTVLTRTLDTVVIGQNVEYTVTVTGANAIGMVDIWDGTNGVASVPVNGLGGATAWVRLYGPIGAHSLTAQYRGDSNNLGSTSAPITQTVVKHPSSVSFYASPNPANVGQAVQLNAQWGGITFGSGGDLGSGGSVTFMNGSTVLGTAVLDSFGRASLNTTFNSAATFSLSVTYPGDTYNLPSASGVQTVQASVPATNLSVSANPAFLKRPVVLTATVVGASPSGTVTFMDGGVTLGTSTLSGGVATFSATFLTAGVHSLTASYSGDANNAATSSSAVLETVIYTPSAITLSSGVNPAPVGQAVTLGAIVTEGSYVVGNPVVSGLVTFMDGATVLGQVVALPSFPGSATAQFTTTFTQAGIHNLTAKYTAVDHATSISNTVYQQAGSITGTPPGPMTWLYSFDAQGGLSSVVDPNGNQTANSYDNLRRVKSTAQSSVGATPGPIVAMSYDGQNRVTSVTDPRALVTTYNVDGLGNAKGLTSPDTGTSAGTYDAAGNVLTETDARGKTKTYTYDAINRVKSISYPTGTTTLFEYDGGASPTPTSIGRLTKVTDESGTTTYTYDGFGNVLTKTQQVGIKLFTVGYTWGATGSTTNRLVAIKYPSGSRANYNYDAAGRVIGLTVNPVNSNGIGTNTGAFVNLLSGITYNGENNILGWTWANNAPYQRAYDGFGRLSTYPIGYPAGTGTAAGLARTVGYDNAGRITGFTHVNSGGTQAAFDQGFGFDELDRLTSHTNASANNNYAYDATGNRTSRTVGATPYANTVAATSNRLTQVQTAGSGGPQTNTYAYDAAGHITTDELSTFTYSDRGRMSGATVGGTTTAYLYNGLEQRVSKAGTLVPSGAGYYVYGESGQILGEYDTNLSPIAETVYLDGAPVAVLKQTGLASNSTLQVVVGNVYSDHLGSPRLITRNSDEAVLWRWDGAEAFGATPPNENPSGLGVYKFNQRFPGQTYDSETATFYNGHRNYKPGIGRYAQSDPIGLIGGINTYGYAGSDPLGASDPTGLKIYKSGSTYSDIPSAGSDWKEAIQSGEYIPGWKDYTPGTVGDDFSSCSAGGGGGGNWGLPMPTGQTSDQAGPDYSLKDFLWDAALWYACPECKALKAIAPLFAAARAAKGGSRVLRELPALDSTGKVHGILPSVKDLNRYDADSLVRLRDELKVSVQRRIEVTVQKGSDFGHAERQAAEQQLIKSIEKHLGN
jgi:RHS repeat-associated protein